jgi:hypothetical protein
MTAFRHCGSTVQLDALRCMPYGFDTVCSSYGMSRIFLSCFPIPTLFYLRSLLNAIDNVYCDLEKNCFPASIHICRDASTLWVESAEGCFSVRLIIGELSRLQTFVFQNPYHQSLPVQELRLTTDTLESKRLEMVESSVAVRHSGAALVMVVWLLSSMLVSYKFHIDSYANTYWPNI